VRRTVVIALAAAVALALAGPAVAAPSARIAALQVALRARGLYPGTVDGISGPLTRTALMTFQRNHRIRATGKIGMATRCKLGTLGTPLLGQRVLSRGRVGWDVASLEFRLRAFGLPAKRVDGRFDAATAAALRRFQRARGLRPDGIAGVRTFRALAHGGTTKRAPAKRAATQSLVHTVQPGEGFAVIARRYGVSAAKLAGANGLTLQSVIVPGQKLRVPGAQLAGTTPKPKPAATRLTHAVRAGESFFSIAQRYHVSPWRLAQENELRLMSTIVPGQRLTLPASAHLESTGAAVGQSTVQAALDRWAAYYGVDPKLVRALAWMESGFQEDVVSSAGAIGVMQLLPETWSWVDTVLLGEVTPRNYEGNVRAGVRYLRWQLDQFGGDVRLALAGYYQGARAVRQRGLFDDTKQYVAVILGLYGSV
jgi:soluble lytic murein transglycosylase-like protein